MGYYSDRESAIRHTLRLMIGISIIAMPILYHAGGSIATLYPLVFVVYYCYGTQLSVNASSAADFWGPKNAGANYGILFTAWGVAGVIGQIIGGRLFDIYKDYRVAFYTAGVICAVALVSELFARRPEVPETARAKAMA